MNSYNFEKRGERISAGIESLKITSFSGKQKFKFKKHSCHLEVLNSLYTTEICSRASVAILKITTAK